MVSYLDETAMNVAQELGDDELYNYDILVKLLGERFDPASHVSASRSRFHGRIRRHHEDADSFAEVYTDFASLSTSTNIHRPAEQVFDVDNDNDNDKILFTTHILYKVITIQYYECIH